MPTVNFLDPRLPDRFWDKVQPCPMSGCWLWTGTFSGHKRNYGSFHLGNGTAKMALAHKVAYEALIGPVPLGLELDHKICSNPPCVNPNHLEPVTHLENVRRGQAGARLREKTHCPKGHPFDETNTYTHNGHRYCRICVRVNTQAFRQRNRGNS